VNRGGCRPFRLPVPEYFTLLRFYLPLVEPDRQISRIRLSDGIREAAHEPARYRSFTAVPRSFRRAESFAGGNRQHGHSPDSSHFQTASEVRPLPSTGVTRLPRYYEPVRHPTRPGLSLAGVRLAVTHRHRWGFPCCVFLLCLRAAAITPVGPLGASIVHFPSDFGLPHHYGVSAPTLVFSRPAQRSLTLRPTNSRSRPRRPFPPEALTASLPPPPLRLLPARTIVAGRDSHPLKKHAFTAHVTHYCRLDINSPANFWALTRGTLPIGAIPGAQRRRCGGRGGQFL
jgi:hypothetical protein